MPTTPTPVVDNAATASLAGGIGNEFSDLQSKYGLLFNPITHSFSQDPNFMNPMQKLEYEAKTDPAMAAKLAQVAAAGGNAGINASQVPGTELGNYRNSSGALPTLGSTYGQLQQGGFGNQPQANNEAVTKLQAQQQQLADAYSSFTKASGGIAGGSIEGALYKVLGQAGIGEGATYNNLMQQLGGQAAGLPSLGTNRDSAKALFSSKIAQLAHQIAGYQGMSQPTQPQMNSFSGASGATSMPNAATSNPYSSTAFNIANPNVSGANDFLASQGR